MEVKYEPVTDFDLHHFGKRHHVHSHYFLFFLFFLLVRQAKPDRPC